MKVVTALPWVEPVWQRISRQISQSRLPHAVLLSGQEGIGKRLLLREVAQLLLCHLQKSNQSLASPCGQCASCHLFDAGSHPDLLMVEPEEAGKQIKIDQIRQVTDFANTTARQGGKKVVLLGPAEAMNINASNALLKNLEEPVTDVTMLLYCHQPSALLATIRSRCQQLVLSSPDWQQGLKWLQANSEDGAVEALLRLAKGAPLKALSMAEQEANIQYLQFCQDIKDIIAANSNWQAVMTKWKAWNITWILEWFYELALDAQKASAALSADQFSLQEMAEESSRVGCVSYEALQSFTQKVMDAKAAVQGQGNPNSVMLIENLLIDWLSMLRHSDARHTMTE